jgi:hypothetical protein
MKKLLFLSTLFLFALMGCFPPMKGPVEKQRELRLAKISAAYEMIRDHQLAWSNAQQNLLYWTIVPGESQQKADLEKFIKSDLPVMNTQVDSLASLLGNDEVKGLRSIMDTVAMGYKSIMTELSDVEAYNTPEIVFLVQSRVFDADGDCTIWFRMLNDLLKKQKDRLHFMLIDDGE